MGNNAAAARTGGAWRNGVTVALSAEHNKKKPSPNNILLDVVVHNSTDMMSFYSGYTLEKTVKNSMYWKAYRITNGAEEELPYVGIQGGTPAPLACHLATSHPTALQRRTIRTRTARI